MNVLFHISLGNGLTSVHLDQIFMNGLWHLDMLELEVRHEAVQECSMLTKL